MPQRFWPLASGRVITSQYGPRDGGFHYGVDFGFPGGSAGQPFYACQSGAVLYAGSAQGYGGDSSGLSGWLVIDSEDADGGGVFEYGHIVRRGDLNVGDRVTAGQALGVINGDKRSNGGVDPHLHLSWMPAGYDPNAKQDPLRPLAGATNPGKETPVAWTGDPVWLADVLKGWNRGPAIKLRELPDWKEYGHGDFGAIWGVMVHHTGNAAETAESIRRGRPDLPGPLSNLHIAPDGTVTVVAAGVCWHAGRGAYPGIPTDYGNQVLIGIECAWPRDVSLTPATAGRERWPDAQIIAMRDTVAAILTRLGVGANRVIGHKEYAGAVQGKWDPGNMSMDWFRGEVNKAMRGEFTPRPPEYPRDWTDRQLLEQIWAALQTKAGA